jgi:WD40 repeat protein
VAFAGGDPIVRLWNLETDEVRTLAGHTHNISDLAFDTSGERLVSSSDDSTARIWDVASGATLRTLTGHTNMVFNLAVDAGGKLLATGGHDYKLILWDLAAGQQRWAARIFNFPSGLSFSPDGRLVATPADGDIGVDLFNVQDGTLVQTIRGHTDKLQAIAFSPDSGRMATGSWDKTVKLWDVATGQETLTLPAGEQVQSLALSRDGRRLVAACDRKTIIWYAPVPDHTAGH